MFENRMKFDKIEVRKCGRKGRKEKFPELILSLCVPTSKRSIVSYFE